ncbi:MAG: CHRD domain-containing protein, partial [Thermoanaerobaculia bacterium]
RRACSALGRCGMQRSLPLAVLLTLLVAAPSAAQVHLTATLRGFEEVPVVSSAAGGTFTATLSEDRTTIEYELDYALSGHVTQAHIHAGQRSVNGGIMIWLCSNLASPPTPPGVQACPDAPGTIHGTIHAADVVGPGGQGISPGEFFEAQRFILRGMGYANVHSDIFPGGEIRGQIQQVP